MIRRGALYLAIAVTLFVLAVDLSLALSTVVPRCGIWQGKLLCLPGTVLPGRLL